MRNAFCFDSYVQNFLNDDRCLGSECCSPKRKVDQLGVDSLGLRACFLDRDADVSIIYFVVSWCTFTKGVDHICHDLCLSSFLELKRSSCIWEESPQDWVDLFVAFNSFVDYKWQNHGIGI